MGQGACSGYQRSGSLIKSSSVVTSDNLNNNFHSKMSEKKKVAALEEQLRQKEVEIEGLQVIRSYRGDNFPNS
jgi:hypothetical protein